jgi:hypothetical protein
VSRADVSSSLVAAIWRGSEPATSVSLREDHHELSNWRIAELLERDIDRKLDLGFAAPGLTHQAQAHSHRVGFLVAVGGSASCDRLLFWPLHRVKVAPCAGSRYPVSDRGT